MLKVGLTGSIATGKSLVAEMLAARGCRVLHADLIAHELMAPGKPAYEEIVSQFGRDILGPTGVIDRQRLAKIVFADRQQLEQLNRILHPRVLTETEQEMARLKQADPQAVVVLEAALLIESGYHKQLDKLIVTWCPPEQQIERLRARDGLTPAAAQQRVQAQMSTEEKRGHADYEIDCSSSLEETEAQVERVYQELRGLAEKPAAR